jgi:hypothetical protein
MKNSCRLWSLVRLNHDFVKGAKIKTHVPERFWDIAPKDAALALVRENCPTELRQAFEFIFDVRENTRLSAKGEVRIRWRCAHCYIVDEGLTVLNSTI